MDQNRDRNNQRHHRQTFYAIDERDTLYDQVDYELLFLTLNKKRNNL